MFLVSFFQHREKVVFPIFRRPPKPLYCKEAPHLLVKINRKHWLSSRETVFKKRYFFEIGLRKEKRWTSCDLTSIKREQVSGWWFLGDGLKGWTLSYGIPVILVVSLFLCRHDFGFGCVHISRTKGLWKSHWGMKCTCHAGTCTLQDEGVCGEDGRQCLLRIQIKMV